MLILVQLYELLSNLCFELYIVLLYDPFLI